MRNEIGRGESCKNEVSLDEPHNPIAPDLNKDGSVREFGKGTLQIPFNYGMIPQTWEDPEEQHSELGIVGDGDPIDAVELGSKPLKAGDVRPVRVLGALALIDQGELDWKVLTVREDDEEEEEEEGGRFELDEALLERIKRWFVEYKVAEGKPANEFAFGGRLLSAGEAMEVLEHTHLAWRRLTTTTTTTTTTPVTHSANVAIVGTGPAGFYAAKYLLKALGEHVRVDLFERLPVPYGLVRSGVAPDHPEVKSVQNDFDVTLADDRVQFFGNVEVGNDVSVDELRELYSGVVLAYGADRDKMLGVPGEDLPGVYAARDLVNWYNSYPLDEYSGMAKLKVENVVVIGQGNVAIDVARILVSPEDRLAPTDMNREALDVIANTYNVRNVHVVGRRGPVQSAFTIKELRELTRIEGAGVVVSRTRRLRRLLRRLSRRNEVPACGEAKV